jgi:uncharacterized protein
MRIVALEEHFILESDPLPLGTQKGDDRELVTGIEAGPALRDLGVDRLAAMDAAGISLQVLSLNQPGCQGLDGAAALDRAREANDYLAKSGDACRAVSRVRGVAHFGPRSRGFGA